MISVKVNVEDKASGLLGEYLSAMTGAGLTDLNEVGARQAVNASRDWHNAFNQRGGWKGNRYMASTAPGVKSGEFGANIAAGWSFSSANPQGAVIVNNAEHYGFRIRGGKITRKRVSWLTIPLVSEAKGIYAKTYQENTGRRLFRPRGASGELKRVLAEKIKGQKGFRSIYALVKIVTLPPFPEGLPTEEMLAKEFTEGWLLALRDKIQKS
jgi:hypothetical protein